MCSPINRLENIIQCIDDIEYILNNLDMKITQAVSDKLVKPAIRMHLVKLAEQFSKLKDDNAFKILENFTDEDLKGINAVRNYIAHDYDSIDDDIIENAIRYNLPILKGQAKKIIKKQKSG